MSRNTKTIIARHDIAIDEITRTLSPFDPATLYCGDVVRRTSEAVPEVLWARSQGGWGTTSGDYIQDEEFTDDKVTILISDGVIA